MSSNANILSINTLIRITEDICEINPEKYCSIRTARRKQELIRVKLNAESIHNSYILMITINITLYMIAVSSS